MAGAAKVGLWGPRGPVRGRAQGCGWPELQGGQYWWGKGDGVGEAGPPPQIHRGTEIKREREDRQMELERDEV